MRSLRLLQVISVSEALRLIQESFGPLDAEEVPLAEAGGRHTAEEVLAGEDVPAFDRSTVDGYAVWASDTFGAQESLPAVLAVVGEVRMGRGAPSLSRGECCYVPTGGMLPDGADAVVMLEHAEEVQGTVQIYRQVAPGENRIQRGEDLRQGQVVFERGRRLRGPELGLLASLGVSRVAVVRRPTVGILSSGDEVVPRETPRLAPGQVRDANSLALAYLARQMDAAVLSGGIIPDSFEAFVRETASMLAQADMVVLSGGSSVGNRDFTARVLRELGGGELLIDGLAVQPGKPTLLAECGGRPLLGLPGHPVSAQNIFALVGGAIVGRLSGASGETWRPSVRARLTRNVPSRPGRTDFIRIRLDRTPEGVAATPVFGRSGLLRTLAEADGVCWVPDEADGLPAGEEVEVFLWV